MRLNARGQIAELEWVRSTEMRPTIALDEFVVMPNHVHGIVMIERVVSSGDVPQRDMQGRGGRSQNAPTNPPAMQANPMMPTRPPTNALGTIINGYKAAVTRQIRSLRGTDAASVWQRNYYEHVIRNDDDLDRIRRYIRNNPTQWALDTENPNRSRS